MLSRSPTLPSLPSGPVNSLLTPPDLHAFPQHPLVPQRPTCTFLLFSAAASSHTPQASSSSSSGPRRLMAAQEAEPTGHWAEDTNASRNGLTHLCRRSNLAPTLWGELRHGRPNAGAAPSVRASWTKAPPLSPRPPLPQDRPDAFKEDSKLIFCSVEFLSFHEGRHVLSDLIQVLYSGKYVV